MRTRSKQRGAALIEFAMVLPFSVLLFVGIGDFAVYFWHMTQMEDVTRFATARAALRIDDYAGPSERRVLEATRSLQEDVRRESGYPNATVTLSRFYACPLPDGGEKDLTVLPQLCPGQRVYLLITSAQAVSPLLQPLRWMGYPENATSRHYLRVR